MKQDDKNLEYWLEKGINFKTREVHLCEEVNEYTVGTIFRAIKHMSVESPDPITVYISSYGGDIYHAFALYDLLIAIPQIIVTVGSGPIMSAGLLLLLAGDIRDVSKNSRIMAHETSDSSIFDSRKTSEIENNLEAQRDIEEAMLNVFEERTIHTKRWWKKTIKHRDVYINRDKALKMGIITGGIEDEE